MKNKRLLWGLAALVFFTFMVAACVKQKRLAGQAAPPVRQLVLLHTSDEHSYLLGVGPEADDYPPPEKAGVGKIKGGIGRRLTIFKHERALAAAQGADVLTASSGDTMMGTLFHTTTPQVAPDYRALKLLGYDVGNFGNHDFELGPAFTAQAIERAGAQHEMIPIVASNIHFSGGPGDARLASLFDATGHDLTKPVHRYWVVQTAHGLRVGFVGVMGINAAHDAPGKAPVSFTMPKGAKETDFSLILPVLLQEIQTVVDQLRNSEKVDVVVVLGHTGLNPGKPDSGESYLIAQNVAGVDVVLSGHTHLMVPAFKVKNLQTGRDVIVEEPGRYGDHVSKLTLLVDAQGKITLDEARTQMIAVDDTIVPDPAVKPLIDEAIQVVGKDWFFKFLGRTRFDMPLKLRKETGMLRLAADAMLDAAEQEGGKTDVAFTAAGIVRDGIWQGITGQITMADAFRVYAMGRSATDGSFGFPLVRFTLAAAEIKAIFELAASFSYLSGDTADYFVFPSGMCFEYDTARPMANPADAANPASGRVSKIALASNHADLDHCDVTLFDLAAGGWKVAPDTLYSVVTDNYFVSFALQMGLAPRQPNGKPMNAPAEAVLHRADGKEVKTYQALASLVQKLAAANQGFLPERYKDGQGPWRAICRGPLCN